MQRQNKMAADEAAGFTHSLQSAGPSRSGPQRHHTATVRKRHWVAGSILILAGSWITHTTTATIGSKDGGLVEASSVLKTEQDKNRESLSAAQNFTALNTSTAKELDSNQTTALMGALDLPTKTEELISQPVYERRTRTIARGESLGLIFKREGLDLRVPHYIAQHPEAKQLTSIRAGKELQFFLDESDTLKEIRYPVDKLNEFVVTLDDDANVLSADTVELEYQTTQLSVSAEISSSLYLAAQNAGLSNNVIMEMVRIFGWDVDFVQDIRRGDHFHLILEQHVKDGEKLADGNILAAEFTTQGQTYQAIRFEDEAGVPSYFNADGESMLGTFLRSPVEFSRISSRFGKRKHPISKKWKAHKGVDYAAPRGTPIRATADGKVTLAGRKGGYGKTVVLSHAGRFSTLYAHMNGFAKGIRSGVRVKQGQTIGYVGSTGMSTGPHLHYEFRVDGVHRNSLTYKTPKASSISEKNKAQFQQLVARYTQQLDDLQQSYMIAKASKDTDRSAL